MPVIVSLLLYIHCISRTDGRWIKYSKFTSNSTLNIYKTEDVKGMKIRNKMTHAASHKLIGFAVKQMHVCLITLLTNFFVTVSYLDGISKKGPICVTGLETI